MLRCKPQRFLHQMLVRVENAASRGKHPDKMAVAWAVDRSTCQLDVIRNPAWPIMITHQPKDVPIPRIEHTTLSVSRSLLY